jgi:phenylacetate-coenzyme A ligase PaaK-like adenylate-forming protein
VTATAYRPVTVDNMVEIMRDRVPVLRLDLDEWTRRAMRWHFGEQTGSEFWLSRRSRLPFDPLVDVTTFADLAMFGTFDKAWLRAATPTQLRPRGYGNRPYRVFETGGTSGQPCRIVDVTRLRDDVTIYRTMLEARGAAGGDILAMTPTGPHAYGHFVAALGASWRGGVYTIDFDPRWVKELIRETGDGHAYVAHLVRQARELLDVVTPRLLFTTSRLLLALATVLDRPLAEHGVRAVCTGGTSCTDEERRFLTDEYLDGVHWIDTYGNTLLGHALQADAQSPDQPHSYHLPPPQGVIRVVEPDDPGVEVAVGQRGRVLIITLLKDLFLPNLLERDSAVRVGPHPWFPWDGVARIRSDTAAEPEITEGIY